MEQARNIINQAVQTLFDIKLDINLTRPDSRFGDFATNVALRLAKKLGKNPHEIAQTIVAQVKSTPEITSIGVAGPGFINIRMADSAIIDMMTSALDIEQTYINKSIVVEYSDPNPFKILHAGHLYTSVVGDAIANLLQLAGAKVHRVNFGGDVGLHVGRTMWAILKSLGGENPMNLSKLTTTQKRTEWLSKCYIDGTNAYDEDDATKEQIIELNKRVYQIHTNGDRTSPFAQIYWTTRQWSYDYFDDFYKSINIKFEKYYPESSVATLGLNTVKRHIQNGIFEQSDGAIIFKGEPYGLHTRVFINKEGLPTYEAKDVGLIFTKKKDFNFDLSVVITGNEQEQYMAVVLKAIEQFAPDLVKATRHLTHGIVKLKGGVKMSSRKGNILRAVDVLDVAHEANTQKGDNDKEIELGAVKYSFLKVRIGGDIIYDPQESVSLEGNSGPYLQYSYARTSSILRKTKSQDREITDLTEDERQLSLKIGDFNVVCQKAINELAPHIVCTYLYELTQEFNRFYEKNRVIGDEREVARITLLTIYKEILKQGLKILNIPVLEKM